MLKSFFKKDMFAKERALFEACETGNFKKVKQLCFDKSVDLECFGKHMDRPLNLAADKGFYNIVKYLVSQKVNIETKGKYHRSPLFRALLSGRIKVAEYLLEQNASIEHLPEIIFDNDEVIKLLIKKRREIRQQMKKVLEKFIITDICNIIVDFVF